MAWTETTSDARVLVGVDISRRRHEVLIAAPGKAASPPSDPHEHKGGFRAPGRRSLRVRPAGQDRVRGDRQLSSRLGESPFQRRFRAQTGVVGRLGADARGSSQREKEKAVNEAARILQMKHLLPTDPVVWR